jgi:hypothetical protein
VPDEEPAKDTAGRLDVATRSLDFYTFSTCFALAKPAIVNDELRIAINSETRRE